jgi:hypothetical protein
MDHVTDSGQFGLSSNLNIGALFWSVCYQDLKTKECVVCKIKGLFDRIVFLGDIVVLNHLN